MTKHQYRLERSPDDPKQWDIHSAEGRWLPMGPYKTKEEAIADARGVDRTLDELEADQRERDRRDRLHAQAREDAAGTHQGLLFCTSGDAAQLDIPGMEDR